MIHNTILPEAGKGAAMEKINGTNLGNWLVLEKWMCDLVFHGTDAEDETWLARLLPPEELAARMKEHRETYVTEEDFRNIASHGLNLVAHKPFESAEAAIRDETDIVSDTIIVETAAHRLMVSDTDVGAELKQSIADLEKLLEAYQDGTLIEKGV